jgi:hypothetical protein
MSDKPLPEDKMKDTAALRECLCQVCDQEYPVWYAPNELWNAVMRYPDGREASEKIHFVCINCFTKEAEQLGIEPPAWVLTTDKHTALIENAARTEEIKSFSLRYDLTPSQENYFTNRLAKLSAEEVIEDENGIHQNS